MKSKLILDYAKGEDLYSDGDIENDILDLFSRPDSQKKVEEILSNNPSWPFLYHLTSQRENILRWYPFEKEGTLLEVGSGCGAITGLFCEKLKRVVAVELTTRRARITAVRHKKSPNLTVIAGNLNDIKIEEKFDFVTSIGVLEYAGKYTNSANPFLDFVLKLKSYLNENGILIIAIENKYGLKYWAGVAEDHTGRLFDSIEGYPGQKGIKTFGKKELQDLLSEAGFGSVEFYYPLPDYKLPVEVFSDSYLPSVKHNVRAGLFPVADPSRPRLHLFNERLASDNLVSNDQFGFFANSFLVFARKGK